MVFLVTTRRAYDTYVALNTEEPLWASAAVLTDDEVKALVSAAKNITVFTHEVKLDSPEVLSQAIDTIEQHHPGEAVWVGI